MAMCCSIQAWSQEPLYVGDRLPDIHWTVVKNYDQPNISTQSFNDRLLILDFWSTFCTACIQAFPKMQKLQEKFGSRLQVILVNATDDEVRIEKYVGMKFLQRFQLPTVFHDSIGNKYFPHRTIPHYVWIYKGQVKAITEGDEVNEKNIQDLFNGKKMSMPQKIMIDRDRLLFTSELLPLQNTVHYSLLLKENIPGIGTGNLERKENAVITGFCFINKPLIEIFKYIGRRCISSFNDRRMVIDVANKNDLLMPEDPNLVHDWAKSHSYTYEIRFAANERANAADIVMEELSRLTPYSVKVEKISTSCMVLRYDSSKVQIAHLNYPGKMNKMKTTEQLSRVISAMGLFEKPVIDGTGFRYIEMNIPDEGATKEMVLSILSEQGYELREDKRELQMLVIRDK
jgi:thiol-disulfide isomerase/thioredoxin